MPRPSLYTPSPSCQATSPAYRRKSSRPPSGSFHRNRSMPPGSRPRALGYSSAIWRRATPRPASSPSSTAQPAACSPSSRISVPPRRGRSRRKRRSWCWARSSPSSGARTPSMDSMPSMGRSPRSPFPGARFPPTWKRRESGPVVPEVTRSIFPVSADPSGIRTASSSSSVCPGSQATTTVCSTRTKAWPEKAWMRVTRRKGRYPA